MILVPYFVDKRNPNWITLGVFLCEGGRSAWGIDAENDSDITAMLLDNGFPVIKFDRRLPGTVFAQIDYDRIKMEHFYLWDEIDPKKSENDVWRFFKIPRSLWSCPIFRDHFHKSVDMIGDVNKVLDLV
jgi:hypothetical protein